MHLIPGKIYTLEAPHGSKLMPYRPLTRSWAVAERPQDAAL